jgi:D-apionolactonase
MNRGLKLYGTEEPAGQQRILNAGALTAILDNGGLRYIRYRGIEVLRAIAYLVRDKNWGTYAPVISKLEVSQGEDGFIVTYDAVCKDNEQKIAYRATIAATEKKLVFSALATPATDFVTNRTGFVVLHPLDGVVGESVQVIHTDGGRARRRFPKLISPGQPIFDIRSLSHQVMLGVNATVIMGGNKFEMEDHRNWMDASYKTYVCSLLDPWPYALEKAKPFTQSITLSLRGEPKLPVARKPSSTVTIKLGKLSGNLPGIGVGIPMTEAEATLGHADILARTRPAYLVCQIDGRQGGRAEAAHAFERLSARVKAPVHLEVILPAQEPAMVEMERIAKAAEDGGLKPHAVIVTQAHDLKSFQPGTPRPWGPSYEEMAQAARQHFPGALVGGGMLSYFTELNRKPVPRGLFDFITHTVCPIVHAADDVSVMETLEALPWIFASVREMIGEQNYHLGPSGISARDNPYGKSVASNPDNARICLSDRDPRQRGQFAAAWNLGLVSAAAQGELDAVALGAATGPQGVIAEDGSTYPAYKVLAALAPMSGTPLIKTTSSAPGKVVGLAAGKSLWLANLTPEKQLVKVLGTKGAELAAYQVYRLDL